MTAHTMLGAGWAAAQPGHRGEATADMAEALPPARAAGPVMRILLDEEAVHELPAGEPPRRFVGFAALKGFSGLHRIYAVDGTA